MLSAKDIIYLPYLFSEDYTTVYSNQHSLARYFQSTGDKWLADHFFNNCLMTSKNVTTDGGVLKADGHCNVGLALEESGEYTRIVFNTRAYWIPYSVYLV